jgi:hypothetical protein
MMSLFAYCAQRTTLFVYASLNRDVRSVEETLSALLECSGNGDGQGGGRHNLRHTHYVLPDW